MVIFEYPFITHKNSINKTQIFVLHCLPKLYFSFKGLIMCIVSRSNCAILILWPVSNIFDNVMPTSYNFFEGKIAIFMILLTIHAHNANNSVMFGVWVYCNNDFVMIETCVCMNVTFFHLGMQPSDS